MAQASTTDGKVLSRLTRRNKEYAAAMRIAIMDRMI
jgi:hypothetical protein